MSATKLNPFLMPKSVQGIQPLLTPDEAARVLGLRRSTLDDYVRRGIVPCVRVGRHRRFRQADLRAYVEAL